MASNLHGHGSELELETSSATMEEASKPAWKRSRLVRDQEARMERIVSRLGQPASKLQSSAGRAAYPYDNDSQIPRRETQKANRGAVERIFLLSPANAAGTRAKFIAGERAQSDLAAEFVGRGDMSRGGLMLRCARAGTQLTYVQVGTATRHGPRPPKLPRLARRAPAATLIRR